MVAHSTAQHLEGHEANSHGEDGEECRQRAEPAKSFVNALLGYEVIHSGDFLDFSSDLNENYVLRFEVDRLHVRFLTCRAVVVEDGCELPDQYNPDGYLMVPESSIKYLCGRVVSGGSRSFTEASPCQGPSEAGCAVKG